MSFFRFIVLFLLSVAAIAGDADLDAVSRQTVDLDKVVELGTVSPVDGFTVSGQPDARSLEVFADSGYAAVIDLRGADENRGIDEQQLVEDLGMHYVSLPVASTDDLNFDNAAVLDSLLDKYDGPVLVHCGSGNRVGAMLALNAFRKGASKQEAIAIGKAGGLTGLQSAVEEKIDEAAAKSGN